MYFPYDIKKSMKLAFVHDWIVFKGGAENVFEHLVLQEDFSQAKIFTLISKEKTWTIWQHRIEIIQALPRWLNGFIFWCDYRNLMPLWPLMMAILSWKIRVFAPEKIVISSFAIAKNIDTGVIPKKLYLHSPMQYIWANYDEYIGKMMWFKKIIFKIVTWYMRIRDKRYRTFDSIQCNSHYTSRLAEYLYDIHGDISYPPLAPQILTHPVNKVTQDYFVYCGRLVRFIREVDLIIQLFNTTQEKLIIIGSGPDELYLKSIAGNTITFVGQVDKIEDKISIINTSRGLINLAKESFGISTVEALALGVPVFGMRDGATPELVDKESGILVPHKELKTLIHFFGIFCETQRDKHLIKNSILKKIKKQS